MMDLAILTAQEAVEWLRAMGMKISPDTLRNGIEQNQFPFGNVVKTRDGTPRCYIYKKRMLQWAAELGYTEGEQGNI